MKAIIRKQWADAKINQDFIEIETYSGDDVGGVPDPIGKVFHFSPDTPEEELGSAVLDALAASRFIDCNKDPGFYDMRGRIVPQYQAWRNKIMTHYGYKTKRAMFKDMKSVSIGSQEGMIKFRPWHHVKLEAWSGDDIRPEHHVIIPAESSPAEVGAALRLAFSRCTG